MKLAAGGGAGDGIGGRGMSHSASARQFGRGRRVGGRSSTAEGGGGGSGYGLWSRQSSSAATLPANFRNKPGSAGSGGGGGGGVSGTGRIVRGTTKQLDELTNVRVKMGELLSQLDDNNREMSMQRREIKRLREQVRLLATQSRAGGVTLPGAPRRPAALQPSLPSASMLPSPTMAVTGLPMSPVGSPRDVPAVVGAGGEVFPPRDNVDAVGGRDGNGPTGPLTALS